MCNSLEIADASFGSLVQRVVAKHCGDLLSEAHDNVTAALVSELQRRVAIARVSLVDSLRVAPLYPVLQTLRYVVVDARVPDGDVQSIVAALFEVAEVRCTQHTHTHTHTHTYTYTYTRTAIHPHIHSHVC